MVIRTTCDKCKEEADTTFYFYDVRVMTERVFGTVDEVEYIASALGRSICPHCGAEIRKQFSSTLYKSDLIKLAIRKELSLREMIARR